MLRKLVFISTILFLFIIGLVVWSGEEKALPVKTNPAVPHYVSAEGRIALKPNQRAVLSAEINGRIEEIRVENLYPVKKGEVLAVLYNADLARQIRQTEESYRKAEAYYRELSNGSRKEDLEEAAAQVRKSDADVELATRNEERDRKLSEEGVISASQYDATAAALKRAISEREAANERYNKLRKGARTETIDAARSEMLSQRFALESLQAIYEKTFVRSPLDGIVITRFRNSSEFAEAGDPIVEVANLSELIVEADVNETDAGRIRGTQKATITTDAYPGREFSGLVYEVSMSLQKRTSDPDDPAVVVDQKILPLKVKLLQPVPFKLGMKVYLKIWEG